jgi:hypothetical protein
MEETSEGGRSPRTWALTEKLETRKQKLENGDGTRREFGQGGGVSVNVGESEFEFVQ